ncbi:energy transducer TonB [Yoonia sediminilitoris]|uniref:Cell division and transport-associated protein TolA n=1 Tax=Yoonia sediminilitoris TaxID=1286148 RepID=A0A2T6KPQ9_9RHOB|nr:energy transducer TonB [Yoonia sediminilitoris]PUB18541.1 cell division and transport-associated protein TolA [Yoonia sediminilitoris]RCW98709.1 cell division and transport-associated protein TolA [Yoonia sediminilitoris]
MRTPGTYISAIGHVGLIGWLLLGWGLDSDPLDFDTMVVTTISGEEFEQLASASSMPDPGTREPDAPVQPVIDQSPPAAPIEEATPEPVTPPDPVPEPPQETPPPAPPQITPPTTVDDNAPVIPAPPPTPSGAPDLAVRDRPTPRPSDVVTPAPNAPPPPDVAVDDVANDPPAQSPEPAEVVVDAPEPETALAESSDRIVSADEQPSGAPQTSVRPQARPSRPTPPVADVAEAEPEIVPPEDTDALVADVLAGIDVDAPTTTPAAEAPNVQAGPPLTGQEESAFRLAVSACWNVNTGSAAADVAVEVRFSLDRDRRVVGDRVELISPSGNDAATRAAFEAARRAILRCATRGDGYQLPAEKYESWKDVVIVFDPSTMRLR